MSTGVSYLQLCHAGRHVCYSPIGHLVIACHYRGDWYIDRKEALVNIYQQPNGTLHGRITWAKDPADNQRLQRETKPVLLLKQFRQTAEGVWEGGSVHPPKIPVTLHGKLILVADNTLQIKAWKLWFSETLTWTRT